MFLGRLFVLLDHGSTAVDVYMTIDAYTAVILHVFLDIFQLLRGNLLNTIISTFFLIAIINPYTFQSLILQIFQCS